jgi:hypothetical protein
MLNHRPFSFESLIGGASPAFLVQDAVYNAGGLVEVHLARGLNEPGLLQLLVHAAPKRIAAALDGSARVGDRKRAAKSHTLKYFFDVAGKPLPECLRHIPMPRVLRPASQGFGTRILWMVKRLDPGILEQIEPNVFASDLALIEHMSVDFFERYHTTLSLLIPTSLRPRVLHGLHAAGIHPYSERDHADLETARHYLAGTGRPSVTSTLSRATPPPACW